MLETSTKMILAFTPFLCVIFAAIIFFIFQSLDMIKKPIKKYRFLPFVSTLFFYGWYMYDIIVQFELCANGQMHPIFPTLPLILFTISFFFILYDAETKNN